jgi:hypothetical protein
MDKFMDFVPFAMVGGGCGIVGHDMGLSLLGTMGLTILVLGAIVTNAVMR